MAVETPDAPAPLEECPKCSTTAAKTHCESLKKPERNRHCPWWQCAGCGHMWKRLPGFSKVPR